MLHSKMWVFLTLAFTLMLGGCAEYLEAGSGNGSNEHDSEFGTVAASLVTPPGLIINNIHVVIREDISGNIVRDEPVPPSQPEPGMTEFRLGRLLTGQMYRMDVDFHTNQGICSSVNVAVDMRSTNAIVNVDILINCGSGGYVSEQDQYGDVYVRATIDENQPVPYPVVTGLDILPFSRDVGQTIRLACHPSSHPVTFLWTTTGGGSFSTTTSSTTDFLCQTVGVHSFTCAIARNGVSGQPGMSMTANVRCTNPATTPTTETSCTDGIDNDGDNLIDCADTADCGSHASCQPTTETSCTDGIDNDGDNLIDCADTADCGSHASCQPTTETSCTDGIDNDGDNLIDCADTADCGSHASCQQTVQCLPQSPVEVRVESGVTGTLQMVVGASYHNGTTAFNNANFTLPPFNVVTYPLHNGDPTEIVVPMTAGQVFSLPCTTGAYGWPLGNGAGFDWWDSSTSDTMRLNWCEATFRCRSKTSLGMWRAWSLPTLSAGKACRCSI